MTTETLERTQMVPGLEGDTAQETESSTLQYVTFIVGNEVFAVDMTPVQEIIRVPEVVRVPLAPRCLDGLSNLRGRVLPIISLRRIFGFPEQDYDDATRAVVIDIGQPLGFVVDRVASVIGVEPGKIEDVGSLRGTVNTDLLSGLLKDVGDHAVVMVLDFAKLIAAEFSDVATVANSAASVLMTGTGAAVEEVEAASGDELQLVSFMVAGQEYAITIEDVQEIVQVPEDIVHVPNSAPHVLGVMTLRNRLLPLVSLRRMFGLPTQEPDERSRIVVVSLGDTWVGVVMDSVNEVLRVARAHVHAVPSLFTRQGDLNEVTEICRLDDGDRLVSVISVGNMFQHSAIKEALTTVDSLIEGMAEKASTGQHEQVTATEEQLVVFRLDKGEFGVPIDSVQEIVRVPDELTSVPKAPAFVEGVINLRGAVLPVIDQRLRLGLEAVQRNDRQRIMVFMFDGVRTGFIVDSVTEVLKVPIAAIESAPHLSGEQAQLISRVVNLEKHKRLIQIIEPGRLVEGQDMQRLAGLTA